MPEFAIPPELDDGEWYHGSPLPLRVLAAGSSITRCRSVAEAFSHKPTCLGIDEDERPVRACHNGRSQGYLYVVDEPVARGDVYPHPKSSFPGGALEWLTNRPLGLRKVADLPVGEPPCLGDECSHRPGRSEADSR